MIVTLHRVELATDDSPNTFTRPMQVAIPMAKIGIMETLFYEVLQFDDNKGRRRVKLYRDGQFERTREAHYLDAVTLMKIDGEPEPIMVVETLFQISQAMTDAAKNGLSKPINPRMSTAVDILGDGSYY